MAQAILNADRLALQWSNANGVLVPGTGQTLWTLSAAQLTAIQQQGGQVTCNADGTATVVAVPPPVIPPGLAIPTVAALPASPSYEGQQLIVASPNAVTASKLYVCSSLGGVLSWHQVF